MPSGPPGGRRTSQGMSCAGRGSAQPEGRSSSPQSKSRIRRSCWMPCRGRTRSRSTARWQACRDRHRPGVGGGGRELRPAGAAERAHEGQVLLLADEAVRQGHVEVDGLAIASADPRGRARLPRGFGVDAMADAFTLWNRRSDPAVRIVDGPDAGDLARAERHRLRQLRRARPARHPGTARHARGRLPRLQRRL